MYLLIEIYFLMKYILRITHVLIIIIIVNLNIQTVDRQFISILQAVNTKIRIHFLITKIFPNKK